MSLIKKLVAEAIGTFVLVFFACGVAALTSGDLVPTALTFGLVIIAMAYSIGRISGCHINPAVSLACAISKRMKWSECGLYVLAQLVGAILGGLAIFGIINATGMAATSGDACNYLINFDNEGYSAGSIISSIALEVVLTAVFVYVILNVTDPSYTGSGKKAGLLIGLTLTLVHLLGIKLTGTSVNPARSIGTAFAKWIYEGKTAALEQVIFFIVAPLAGGALASLIFALLHKNKKVEE